MKAPHRIFFLIAGFTALSAGVVGAFLPILPTTPFILLAAFCFSRSSPRLHRWLREHQIFGKLVQDWEEKGSVARKPKLIATAMIIVLFGYTLIFVPVALLIKVIVTGIGIGVLLYLWSLPES